MSSQLVALIIGAGPNVGNSVAKHLALQNYKVAIGSRNPKPEEREIVSDFYPFVVDITRPDSIRTAFQDVSKALGPPNVVVFNAATFVPTKEDDPLSLPFEGFKQATTVVDSFYVATQEALAAFRSPIHKDSPKTFIATGNLLPFHLGPPAWLGLALQKRAEAYLTQLFHNAYIKEGIRFHYMHLVSPEGSVPPYDRTVPGHFWESGPAHATAAWRLISAEVPETWDYWFTFDGKRYERR